ncbi:hypothetical protein [Kineococcus rhizosphaerae]|uniref:Uncharacterized protein n=1 Tax=Kineococcus rhizosphaerae TaxID=559628 RepID=A0A2T0R8E1_9ACTN|nr:hypothetical protein [Kineococcus rhizosphaerae]PRY17412.1 hypothetical protein CLV37_102375 [Kineococcus rhizosphaerae]
MFTGLPDLGRPDGPRGFAVHDEPGAVCVLPTRLSAHPLRIDRYVQDRGDRVTRFTLVQAGFEIGGDEPGPSRVRPAPLGSGWVRLSAPAALDVPAAALAPQPWDAATGVVLPTLVRLDDVTGELLAGAVRGGLQTLGAVVLVTVPGVAARCPGQVTVDARRFLADVGTDPVAPDDLLDRTAAGWAGVSVAGGPQDPRTWAAAVLDRLVARLAVPALDADREGWRFAADPGGTPTFSWDLTGPCAARRLLRLACDPLRGTAAVVTDHVVAPLSDGRERVLVHSTLPGLPAGVLAATATLTAPATPARPFPAEVTADLRPPGPSEVVLALAPGETLAYDLTGAAALETDRGPRTVEGAARPVAEDRTPVLTPADLGIRVLPVHATRALLDLADVTVSARTTRLVRDPAVCTASVVLRAGAGDGWLAVPRDAHQVSLTALASAHADPARTVGRDLPDAEVWLDPFSFPDAPWADPGPRPEPVLVAEVDGLRAAGTATDPDWRFLPLRAGVVRDGTGQPQLTLVEAAGLAWLTVGTALELSDAAQDALRTRALAAGAPAGLRLAPAPFEVDGAAELRLARDGSDTTLATAVTSATTSQDAAFSVQLAPDDLAPVHRALAGETGLLRVRYVLRVAASGPLAQALAAGPVTVETDAATWRP